MKKLILLYIILLFMGCANKAKYELQMWPKNIEYEIPFKKGLVLMKEDVIKIMLLFERKPLARFFMTDTYEDINVYILANKYTIEESSILLEKPKIFFIRGQMSTSYGGMSENSITIKKDKDKIYFSGNLVTDKIINGDRIFANVIFSCEKLKLQKVSSISEMLAFDIYNKEFLDEKFHEFYNGR
jgi:hypothetical protein